MSENMKFKRKVLSRKKIISSFLVVLVLSLCLGGFMYGLADSFEDFADIRILQIGFLVLFPLFTVIMWVPLCLGGGQIYDMREDALVIIPAMATTGAQLNQGGPGLLFVYLPNLIKSMPGSTLIAMIFFELMQVKPLLGSLLYKGICPPSKPTRTFPPERDF